MLIDSCFFRTALSHNGGLTPGEGCDDVLFCGLGKLQKLANSTEIMSKARGIYMDYGMNVKYLWVEFWFDMTTRGILYHDYSTTDLTRLYHDLKSWYIIFIIIVSIIIIIIDRG